VAAAAAAAALDSAATTQEQQNRRDPVINQTAPAKTKFSVVEEEL
jgi:hypothetical protein